MAPGAADEKARMGNLKRSCAHLLLFSFGFLAGYAARDFVFWQYGGQGSSIHWLQNITSGWSFLQSNSTFQALRATGVLSAASVQAHALPACAPAPASPLSPAKFVKMCEAYVAKHPAAAAPQKAPPACEPAPCPAPTPPGPKKLQYMCKALVDAAHKAAPAACDPCEPCEAPPPAELAVMCKDLAKAAPKPAHCPPHAPPSAKQLAKMCEDLAEAAPKPASVQCKPVPAPPPAPPTAKQLVKMCEAICIPVANPVRDCGVASKANLVPGLPPPPKHLRGMCKVAQETAVKDQLIVFIGDKNVFTLPENKETLMYQMLQSLIRLKVNNILLVATDPEAYMNAVAWMQYVSDKGIRLHAIERDIATPGILQGRWFREQQSAKKFPVIRDLLKCHVHVLLSDFDVLFWDNPFNHIVGDADLEGMTDGWDYNTKFGWEVMVQVERWWPPWEWRSEFLNSGFFYVTASNRTIRTMDAIWTMLQKENIWDQAAYNCQVRAPLGTPKNGRLQGEGLRVRVMDTSIFPNSRVFHEIVDPKNASSEWIPPVNSTPPPFQWPNRYGVPIAMHVNYHREKVKMMAYARRTFDPIVARLRARSRSAQANGTALGNRSRLGNRSALGNRSRLGNRSALGNRSRLGNRSGLGNWSKLEKWRAFANRSQVGKWGPRGNWTRGGQQGLRGNWTRGGQQGLRGNRTRGGQQGLRGNRTRGRQQGLRGNWTRGGQQGLHGNWTRGRQQGLRGNWTRGGQQGLRGNWTRGGQWGPRGNWTRGGPRGNWSRGGQRGPRGNWSNGGKWGPRGNSSKAGRWGAQQNQSRLGNPSAPGIPSREGGNRILL